MPEFSFKKNGHALINDLAVFCLNNPTQSISESKRQIMLKLGMAFLKVVVVYGMSINQPNRIKFP